jgi:hypothetical protein
MLVCALKRHNPRPFAVLKAIDVLVLPVAAYLGVTPARGTTLFSPETVAPLFAIFPKALGVMIMLAAVVTFGLYRGRANQLPGYVSAGETRR